MRDSERRDVALVLSGGGINATVMELGFLRRVRESELWPRVGWIFGTSAGALTGIMAALDRLDDLEHFLLLLRPEDTFRPHRLWRLPLLGLHDYALPRTIAERLEDPVDLVRGLEDSPIELVVLATDLSVETEDSANESYELAYSSRTTPPEEMAQALLASSAVSAFVLPLRVGDRIASDGGWVRNFPLGYAFERPEVELIVSFRYLPRYPQFTALPLQAMRRRLERLGRVPPVRAFIAELKEAEERTERGEPAHLADMLARLGRVSILRNTVLEERTRPREGRVDRGARIVARRHPPAARDRRPRPGRACGRRARGRGAVRGCPVPVPARPPSAADRGTRLARRGQPRSGPALPETVDGERNPEPDRSRLRARRRRAARGRRIDALYSRVT